jgi:membrane associated rhomboid family serine protease
MNKDYRYITLPIKMLALIWIVFTIDTVLIGISFCKFGLLPRTTQGLFGIATMPFIHAGLFHIISNSVPLFVLLSITAVYFKDKAYTVVILIVVISGILLWLLGRTSYHVGASGLIYGLAAFLVAFGVYMKKVIPLIISVTVAGFYGASMLIGLLPIFPGVSWDGHLFGAIAGVITARIASSGLPNNK